MEKKIIFFDVDGTLVTFDQGTERILPSTIEAIRRTRAKGNLVYLCTGRSKAEIYDFIMDIGIDGIIGAGGGFIETQGTMLYHKKVQDECVKHMVDYFEKHKFDYYLESNGGLFASHNLKKRLEYLLYGDFENDPIAMQKKKEGNHFIDSLIEGEDMYRNDINKACFLENKNIPFERITKQFEKEFTIIHCTVPAFGENSGELTVPNIHKANAIKILIDHLGIDQKNTYAFGDGLNDIEMLEYCQVGIAMGNAKQGLKAVANEITDDANKDGIYKAMIKHNLV